MKAAPLSVDESVAGIVKKGERETKEPVEGSVAYASPAVDSATLETTSGHFLTVESDEDLPW